MIGRETKLVVGTVTHGRPKDECCSNCKFCLSFVECGFNGFRKSSNNIEVFFCHREPPKIIDSYHQPTCPCVE
jgi:hypothetical protein